MKKSANKERGIKICVVTGSRADYGLLYWIIRGIRDDGDLFLQLVATGSHLSPEFGLTYQAIEDDGFSIDAKVEMLLSSDSPVGIAKAIGLGTIGFADAFSHLNPDLLLLLGDRFEILAAAQAALVAKIPIAHIAGGDITEGAYDDAIRHAITKMAHLHFVTNEDAGRRVRQLGEDPARVFNVGSPGIDFIRRMQLLSRDELAGKLGFPFRQKNLLVTFHPETLGNVRAKDEFGQLLEALGYFDQRGVGQIITKPNADNEGRGIVRMIDDYVARSANARAYASLGQNLYLGTMAQIDCVVGNSSSGLYEAPSFRKPTVNIGNRQKGRLQASSVINCGASANAIIESIHEALVLDCAGVVNPYGDGYSTERILRLLQQVDFSGLVQKRFFHVS